MYKDQAILPSITNNVYTHDQVDLNFHTFLEDSTFSISLTAKHIEAFGKFKIIYLDHLP